jgi:hypothetical protein
MIRPWTEITDVDALTGYDVYAFDLDDTLGPSQREVPAPVRAELATLCARGTCASCLARPRYSSAIACSINGNAPNR